MDYQTRFAEAVEDVCHEGRRKSMLSRKPVDHPCLQALTHPRLRLRLRRR